MKRKQFYLVEIPDSDYQVLIFRVKNYSGTGVRDLDTYDFYLSDCENLVYQFGIPCKDISVCQLEDMAISNFISGNMCF